MLAEIIKKNRSFRKFNENVLISNETLLSFIDNTRLCPTARNQQVIVYKTVVDKIEREKIFPQLKWAGYLKEWDGPVKGERPTGYIVVAINLERLKNNDDWIFVDLGIVCQTILLQATEKNFGGCIIGAINKPKIRTEFNIPDHIEPKVVIALGKPTQRIDIKEIENNEDIKYYCENEKHIVPKRKLKDIIF